MVIFTPASLRVGNIYHQVQNGETRPTVISVVREVARTNRVGVAPPNRSVFASVAAAGGGSRGWRGLTQVGGRLGWCILGGLAASLWPAVVVVVCRGRNRGGEMTVQSLPTLIYIYI